MPTLQERRRVLLAERLDVTIEVRDQTLAKLVKLEGKAKWLRKQLARYDKLVAKPVKQKPVKPTPAAAPEPVTVKPLPPELLQEYRDTADDPPIPDFLRRTREEDEARRKAKAEGDRKDAEAAAKMKAEEAERKQAKASGRANTKKAQQRGDLKKMPLSGKAALAAIRQSA